MAMLDMGGFAATGGAPLVDRFGRSLRDTPQLQIPIPKQHSFIASGGEAGFVLAAVPMPNTLQVYRNRVLVHPSVYSLSGVSVTLANALTYYVGDIIDVSYLTISPIVGAAALKPAGGYAAQVLADSPEVYMLANDTSGTVMTDSSGHGRHGTYNSGVLLNQTALRVGSSGCIGMSSNSYAARNTSLPSMGAVTFECIIQCTGGGSVYSAAMQDQQNTRAIAYFGASRHHLSLINHNNDSSSPNNTFGTIVHAVLTVSGGTWNLYENGLLAATDSYATVPDTTNMTFLGDTVFPGSFGWIGYGSDFAVYSYALSATRIATHYASMFTFAGDQDAGVVSAGTGISIKSIGGVSVISAQQPGVFSP